MACRKMVKFIFFHTINGAEVKTLGKVTVTLSDEVEKKLRQFVTTKYPEKPYGKLSQVVEEALKNWLDEHSRQ